MTEVIVEHMAIGEISAVKILQGKPIRVEDLAVIAQTHHRELIRDEVLIDHATIRPTRHVVDLSPKRVRNLQALGQAITRVPRSDQFDALVEGLMKEDRVEQAQKLWGHDEGLTHAGPMLDAGFRDHLLRRTFRERVIVVDAGQERVAHADHLERGKPVSVLRDRAHPHQANPLGPIGLAEDRIDHVAGAAHVDRVGQGRIAIRSGGNHGGRVQDSVHPRHRAIHIAGFGEIAPDDFEPGLVYIGGEHFLVHLGGPE